MADFKVQLDFEEEFITAQSCLFQMTSGEKFLPGLVAITGSQLLIFSDYAPSESIGCTSLYHPVFSYPFSGVKYVSTGKLYGNKELKDYIEMIIVETDSNKSTTIFFNGKKAKNYKKLCNAIKKVGKIKIKKRDHDCTIYN